MSHAFVGVLTCAHIHSIELDRECLRATHSPRDDHVLIPML